MKKYYKTNRNEILNELHKVDEQKEQLVLKANKVALTFNAKPMLRTSTTGISFGGLVLNDYQGFTWETKTRDDKLLWTAPNSNNLSWPRKSLTKTHCKHIFALKEMSESDIKAFMKEQREMLKLLQNEYRKLTIDIKSVTFDGFFKSLGTDWGNLMFGGMKWFKIDGFVYISSGCDLSEKLTEILGSEFEKAQNKNNK